VTSSSTNPWASFGETTGVVSGRIKGVDLTATGVYEIVPAFTFGDPADDALVFPQFAYAVLRSKVGAVTTAARIRIGGNATHDDVMPLFIVPAGAQVGGYAMPPLVVSPYVPPNLRAGSLSFEVERAAIGPSQLTGDILIVGMLVSG
jgi:hypothetical protein